MKYGKLIGVKFGPDARALCYNGNTVVSDVDKESPAFKTLTRARNELIGAGLGEYFIFLPPDSYHMTVIRGLNDSVRTPAFWPAALPADCTMETADDYVESAVTSVKSTGGIRMVFAGASAGDEDVRILLSPANDEQARELKRFRDEAAKELGLKLAGHDGYTYHITLGYTRYIAGGEIKSALEGALERVRSELARCPAFELEPPHVAFYRDMLSFHRERIPR